MQGFLDECVFFYYFFFFFAFYVEIQDSQNHSISHRFRDKRIFAFNAEIQDGHQKWRENDFCEKSLVDPADTLWVKIFDEIALSRTVSEIKAFLRITQKFKMAAKNGGKVIFRKWPVDPRGTSRSKIASEMPVPHSLGKYF